MSTIPERQSQLSGSGRCHDREGYSVSSDCRRPLVGSDSSGSGNESCPIGPQIEAVLKEVVAESEARFHRNSEQTTIAEFSTRVVQRLNCQEEK